MTARSSLLLILLLCTWLHACSPPLEATPTERPPQMPTHAPTAAATPTTHPTVASLPTPTAPSPERYLESADLSSFAVAWTSGDVAAIRSLYTNDARCFSEDEAWALDREQPFSVLVRSEDFAARAQEHQGLRMRILGEPIGIYGKLVAFAYRWENDSEGYDGVGLLRYEGSLIFLHVFVEAAGRTPDSSDDSSLMQVASFAPLMKAWDTGDVASAQAFYSNPAAILSDEDLAKVAWRDFARPPDLASLIKWFRGWKPAAVGTATRVGDLVFGAWRWETQVYPVAYGVRLLHYDGGAIVTDIRFAIRPWEVSGKPFTTP